MEVKLSTDPMGSYGRKGIPVPMGSYVLVVLPSRSMLSSKPSGVQRLLRPGKKTKEVIEKSMMFENQQIAMVILVNTSQVSSHSS